MNTDAVKLKEVTREELKDLVREVMEEYLWELEQMRPDPDAGLNPTPEIARRLEKARQLRGERPLHTHQDVKRELGLD